MFRQWEPRAGMRKNRVKPLNQRIRLSRSGSLVATISNRFPMRVLRRLPPKIIMRTLCRLATSKDSLMEGMNQHSRYIFLLVRMVNMPILMGMEERQDKNMVDLPLDRMGSNQVSRDPMASSNRTGSSSSTGGSKDHTVVLDIELDGRGVEMYRPVMLEHLDVGLVTNLMIMGLF